MIEPRFLCKYCEQVTHDIGTDSTPDHFLTQSERSRILPALFDSLKEVTDNELMLIIAYMCEMTKDS